MICRDNPVRQNEQRNQPVHFGDCMPNIGYFNFKIKGLNRILNFGSFDGK